MIYPYPRRLDIALIRPLAWEPPYAVGVAPEMAKKDKKKKKDTWGKLKIDRV